MKKVKPPKEIWDGATHTIYMDVRVEEVRANNCSTGNTTLSHVEQANFLTKFNEQSRITYSHHQLKTSGIVRLIPFKL